MVLVLDTDTSTSSSDISPTMKRGSVKGKSLGQAPPKKSLSLLVDYSKRKANVSSFGSTAKEVFGNVTLPDSLRDKTPAETIDHALNLVTSLSDDTTNQLEDSQASFALDDMDLRPVSFRVRKASIRRSKSMDDRIKISSYDHLQNSIRCALLMQDDEDNQDDKSQAEDVPERRVTISTATSTPSVDRRAQLANLRKKHNSMKNLSARNLANQTQRSLRNLNSATAACAPSSQAPNHSPPPIPRRTRDPNKNGNNSLNSKSMHQGGGRRASMVAAANSKCKSCRNLITRSKSMQESAATLQTSISILNGGSLYHGGSSHNPNTGSIPKGSLHIASDHSTASQVSFASSTTASKRPTPKRVHTTGGMGRRGSSLAMMKAQTMSRRNLLEGALSTMDDESSAMDESAIFFAGSRIRRLDASQM